MFNIIVRVTYKKLANHQILSLPLVKCVYVNFRNMNVSEIICCMGSSYYPKYVLLSRKTMIRTLMKLSCWVFPYISESQQCFADDISNNNITLPVVISGITEYVSSAISFLFSILNSWHLPGQWFSAGYAHWLAMNFYKNTFVQALVQTH